MTDPDQSRPPPPGWEDILDPGEVILWQGQPEARFDLSILIRPQVRANLIMSGFALFWLTLAFFMTSGAPFVVRLFLIGIGLFTLLQLLGQSIAPALYRWLRLRGSYYTLTDRNAFIATSVLGRRGLERYPLDSQLSPQLEEGLPGSVWLTRRKAEAGALFRGDLPGYFASLARSGEQIGFEQIPGARRVFTLVRDTIAARQPPRGRRE
ncbi:hypothetical protein [Pseudogemmobacter faecipullorum]|uniref:Aspartate carbamoyltransferase catalytic subunit n=1 Tax=Pseudogemmobacter faecipullorum TaxID=2755041 RepID=A0ABS8CNL8_9RHOB|nr:hypothetical protein [Pseudogemmobacter faecipullorum]MCB5410991.1 hypothetical protein [Pseudogemmobacter faecipullorum]